MPSWLTGARLAAATRRSGLNDAVRTEKNGGTGVDEGDDKPLLFHPGGSIRRGLTGESHFGQIPRSASHFS